MAEFEKAKDKILMGAERKSMVMSEEEKTMTAYHEAGHAIVGRLVPDHDPVYKVSIIPRGRALGVTMYLPEQDRLSHSKRHLESMISSLYGGRIAEEIIFGKDCVSTGASNDIERATDISRKMVTQWGLSEKLGPMKFADEQGEMFTQQASMSDDTAKLIDDEIRYLVESNYKRAHQLLSDNMDVLHSMKDALMKYETIDAKQIDDLMARVEVRPPADWGEGYGKMDKDASKETKIDIEKKSNIDLEKKNIKESEENSAKDNDKKDTD